MKHTKEYDINFKKDLEFGLKWENKLKKILKDVKVEVKTDRKWSTTGNLAVEIESRNKPSGIKVTTAQYWSFILWEKDNDTPSIILISTDKLKIFVEFYLKKNGYIYGGDNKTSKLVLIPINKVFNHSYFVEKVNAKDIIS